MQQKALNLREKEGWAGFGWLLQSGEIWRLWSDGVQDFRLVFQLTGAACCDVQIPALAAIYGLVETAALVGVQIVHLDNVAGCRDFVVRWNRYITDRSQLLTLDRTGCGIEQ
jgi:hypothetical protein